MICSAYSRASGNSARADNLVIASLAKQSSFIARPCWIASSLTLLNDAGILAMTT